MTRKWSELSDDEQEWVIDHLHVFRFSQSTHTYSTPAPGEADRTNWHLSDALEAGIQFLDNSRNKFKDKP